jgi:hypothetical protein
LAGACLTSAMPTFSVTLCDRCPAASFGMASAAVVAPGGDTRITGQDGPVRACHETLSWAALALLLYLWTGRDTVRPAAGKEDGHAQSIPDSGPSRR